jgi:hypothetical protein
MLPDPIELAAIISAKMFYSASVCQTVLVVTKCFRRKQLHQKKYVQINVIVTASLVQEEFFEAAGNNNFIKKYVLLLRI